MERFEENYGRYTYVNLPQIKDYLGINSNTKDASLSNVINYATAAIEHYIGQEVIANNYSEIFDGGQSSVFVNRLPLNNVHAVAEFDGNSYEILQGPNSDGTMVDTESKDSKNITNVDVEYDNNRIVLKQGINEILFTHYDVKKKEIIGYVNEVSEDLRDYLRREGIKIYTNKPFKSIKPEWL